MINADKASWEADIEASVEQYNEWFLRFAPGAFRDARAKSTVMVEEMIRVSSGLAGLTADVLKANPQTLPALRMCCCPM